MSSSSIEVHYSKPQTAYITNLRARKMLCTSSRTLFVIASSAAKLYLGLFVVLSIVTAHHNRCFHSKGSLKNAFAFFGPSSLFLTAISSLPLFLDPDCSRGERQNTEFSSRLIACYVATMSMGSRNDTGQHPPLKRPCQAAIFIKVLSWQFL